MGDLYAIGADSGASAGWALVRLRPGKLPELVELWPVYGTTAKLWLYRASATAKVAWQRLVAEAGTVAAAQTATVWIETPPEFSRKGKDGKRHSQQSWIGLGRRVGGLEMAWYAASSEAPECVEPTQWWNPWGGVIRRGKDERDKGLHRVKEAGRLVKGAAAALETVPATRRIDCAESILVAGAAALNALEGANAGSVARRLQPDERPMPPKWTAPRSA